MKIPATSTFTVLSISAAIIATSAGFNFFGDEQLDPKATDTATVKLTTNILESSQFSHQKLDDELAKKFLDRYLKSLDDSNMLFLKSDVIEFKGSLPTLARTTREKGDYSPAHTIFDRFLKRLNERAAYVKNLLETEKFDFSKDETYTYDREKAERPATLDEAKKIWHQQIRSEYLQAKLGDEKDAEIKKSLTRRINRVQDSMKKLTKEEVLEIYLDALTQVYDPHSDYMSAKQLKEFQNDMNLSLIGIGASLGVTKGYCTIKELIAGGPAERSGLIKPGDRIVGVGQNPEEEYTDIIDYPLNKAVQLIRGKKNSVVYLEIIPADADDSVRKKIKIAREEIKVEDQQAKAQVVDLTAGDKTHRIGTIELPTFYAGDGDGKNGPTSATADVYQLINKLKQENVTGIILDLRRNGGGSLQEAIDLTGLFIPSGAVVQTKTPEGRIKVDRDKDDKVAYDGPLVVLTSRFSASASEIVAGALQDYGRAVVVGDKSTFGKGTVQTIVQLGQIMQSNGVIPNSDPGALKLTISKFYRPSGKSTQLEGVKTDIVIPSITDLPDIGESALEGPLPWDTIPAAKFEAADQVTQSLETLRTRSNERIVKNQDFTQLKQEIERFQKLRDEKTVSLNEAKRKAEKQELKARSKKLKQERLARANKAPTPFEVTFKNINKPGLTDLLKPKKTFTTPKDEEDDGLPEEDPMDLVLLEAQNILIDYSNSLKGQPLAQVTFPEKKTTTE